LLDRWIAGLPDYRIVRLSNGAGACGQACDATRWQDQSTSREQNLTVRNPISVAIFPAIFPAIFAATPATRPGFLWATDAVRKTECFL
jgi:hypothetical protein